MDYRTATRYLTRHLPFTNELLYDLVVLHPLIPKEDQACNTLNCNETITDNEIGLCRPTNGRYTNGRRSQRIGTSLDIKEMDTTPTEK